MDSKDSERRELGRAAAQEVKVPPLTLDYIEARGVLCANLPKHLGGPFWMATRLCARLKLKLRIAPVCRWYPPNGSRLELVGRYKKEDIRFYRITRNGGQQTIFETAHRPMEDNGRPFKYPDLRRVLAPPFDVDPSLTDHERGSLLSRKGMWEEFCR